MIRPPTSLLLATVLAVAMPAFSQPPASDDRDATIASLQSELRRLQTQQMHQGQQVRKDIDDWMWHYFNRIDTPLARESRKDILAFLARHLK